MTPVTFAWYRGWPCYRSILPLRGARHILPAVLLKEVNVFMEVALPFLAKSRRCDGCWCSCWKLAISQQVKSLPLAFLGRFSKHHARAGCIKSANTLFYHIFHLIRQNVGLLFYSYLSTLSSRANHTCLFHLVWSWST